ncbi:MAG: T9SS type A sorting domain-containing protein, partial [Bacteroidota bacterium]
TVTIRGLSTLNQGNYEATLTGSSSEGTSINQTISLTKLGNGNVPGPLQIYPIDVASDTRPELEAEDTNADFFEIQLSDQEDFSTLLISTSQPVPRFTPTTPLAPNTRYYWRIRGMSAQSGCNATNWATASFISGSCYTYIYEGESAVIGEGLPPQIAELPITIPISGEVKDVDLLQLDITHSFLGDLEIELIGPDATTIPLFNRNCSSNENLLFSFDDEANSSAYFCPPINADLFVKPPSTPLSSLDNREGQGLWTLRVTDRANQDGGTLNGFGLKICLENVVLPVTFLEFNARGRKQDIELSWTTEEEVNNEGFYVERTTDATQGQWVDLGFVAAGAEYRFLDATVLPNVDYYYRLRQTDFDGTVSYSEIRVARLGNASSLAALLLYPNPATSNVNYRWAVTTSTEEQQQYQLFDVQGQLLGEGLLFPSGGSLQLSSFPPGVYFLRVVGQKEGQTFRLVKR